VLGDFAAAIIIYFAVAAVIKGTLLIKSLNSFQDFKNG
jgi:hypothetical protein